MVLNIIVTRISVDVSCALEKRVYVEVLGHSILSMSINSVWSIVLFRTSVPLLILSHCFFSYQEDVLNLQVDLSISPFNSVKGCLIYFEALLLQVYTIGLLCLANKLTL